MIDQYWKEHLRELDDLRQSVQNASYEQKDPLLIYKFESFELFRVVIDKINKDIIASLTKAHIPLEDPDDVKEAQAKRTDLSTMQTSRDDQFGDGKKPEQKKMQPIRTEKKVGRNDPCPCGSGRKYKNCHGKQGAESA